MNTYIENEIDEQETFRDVLTHWRFMYQEKDTLRPFIKDQLVRLCSCIAKLEPLEQTALTEKYFNLKPLPTNRKSNIYFNRKQLDKEVASKMDLSVTEYQNLKRKSTYKLYKLWRAYEE